MSGASTTRERPLSRVPSQLIEPRLTPWPRNVALLVGATPLGAGVLALMQPGIPMALPLTVGTALTALVGWRGLRCNRRQRRLADLSNLATMHLEAPLQILTGRRWQEDIPHEMVAAVPPRAHLALGAMASTSICAAVGKALGQPVKVVKKPNRAGRMMLALAEAPTAETTDEITQRINDVARQTLGPTATARVTSDNDGQPNRVDITHQAGPKLTVESIQRRILNALTSRMTGDWRTHVDLENDTITLTRRTPLPTKIDRPTGPVAAGDQLRIPQAIDEDGQIHYWDFSGVMAHQLFSGRTRTGKTVKLIGDCIELARRGLRVWVIDPKRIEFLGLRDWPNVQLVATTIAVQIAAIMEVKQLMDERYRQVEEDGVDERSFDRFVLIIDEYRIFYSEVKDWWARVRKPGMPAQCPVFEWIGALLRMAAAARIHVVLATQRPDAEFLGGEQRDNFSARGNTGRLGPDGAEMMYDSTHVGTKTPLNVQGRGTLVDLSDKPREVQFFYTPDPRKATPEEWELLNQLRPTTTTWEPLSVEFPDEAELEQLVEEHTKVAPEWLSIQHAQFVPLGQEDTIEDVAVETGPEKPADGFGIAAYVAARDLQVGDLAGLDDDEDWVEITALEASDHGDSVLIEWRHAITKDLGEHELAATEPINTRRRQPDPRA